MRKIGCQLANLILKHKWVNKIFTNVVVNNLQFNKGLIHAQLALVNFILKHMSKQDFYKLLVNKPSIDPRPTSFPLNPTSLPPDRSKLISMLNQNSSVYDSCQMLTSKSRNLSILSPSSSFTSEILSPSLSSTSLTCLMINLFYPYMP